MVPGRCLFLLVFLCNLVRALGNCLNASDVVPVADRINIVVNGESLPIGFSSPDWDSAKIYSRIAEIITQEILGFNTQMGPHGDESQSAYKLVAEGNSIHFLSEIWSSFTAEIIAFEAANPSLALPLLKTLDYKGRDGMHIFPKSSEPYYDSNGRSLEFYQYFNASVLTLTTEFSPISAFDINSLSACDGSESGPTEQSYYLSATGDAGAFTVLNGVRTWNCHQGKWWLSPACRNDPSTCVPLLTHLFWGWSEMRQKAAYFNMPIAMGSTPSAELYVEWPKNHKMLAYWWTPDDKFKAEGALQMFFPDHNPGEWDVGVKTSMPAEEPLWAYYKPGVDSAAPKVFLVLSNMALYDDDMTHLLNEVVRLRTQGVVSNIVDTVACNWLNNNVARWRAWIPIATECTRSLGFGMTAENGTFVLDRAHATGCTLCSPGKYASSYADDVGQSAVCLACPSGSAQDRGGQTECAECAAGTYRVDSGVRCSPCGKGTYQPAVAQDSCLTCMSPMTTVTVGSDTQELCICPAGTFQPCLGGGTRSECACPASFYTSSSSRCVECPEGMYCNEGSDEQFFPCSVGEMQNSTSNPYPKPSEGYFVLLEKPTDVYKCIDEPSCPGDFADHCGDGLMGVACGACAAGFYKQAGSCNECGDLEQNPLFLILPLLVSPVFVFAFYKVSLVDVHLWGRTGQGFGGIGYLMLVYVQTVSVIISIFPTLPATLAGGVGWTATSAEITSLFRLECAGPSDFVGSFILNLVLPEIAGAIFFVTWLGAMLIGKFVPKLRMDGDVVLGCFGAILKTFFVTVASKCFSLFQLYRHPNGSFSMRASPEVLQGSEEWSSMVIFSAMAICVNCVFLLVVISWAMWVAPRRFHLKSFRMRWKFMIQKMRPSVYWWMMTIFFKGLWISLTGVLFTNAMRQSLWICFGLLFYTTISYVFLPWRSVFVTILDIGTHVSTLLLCLLLPFLIDFDQEEQQTAVTIFVTLSILGFLSVVGSMLWALVKGFSPWWKRRRERNIEYYAQRMADVFSSATEPRLLAEMMTEIPALDILEIKYVATMMSSELLGKHVIGRLDWGEPALADPVKDQFTDGVARSQVIWT